MLPRASTVALRGLRGHLALELHGLEVLRQRLLLLLRRLLHLQALRRVHLRDVEGELRATVMFLMRFSDVFREFS